MKEWRSKKNAIMIFQDISGMVIITTHMNVLNAERLNMSNDLIIRLRTRAEIRRQIPSRKSVQEGKEDRLADILDEAADEIERLNAKISELGWMINPDRMGQ
jgi:hypothetical protein